MKEKMLNMLEAIVIEEGFAGAMAKKAIEDKDTRDKIEASCTCGGKGGAGKRSKKKCNHASDCGSMKEGLVVEEEDFDDTELVVESKKGRPKKEEGDKDDSGKGGVRDITLTATVKIDGKTQERKKKLSDVNVDDIDKEKDKFEKQVNKEFDYDADVTVKVTIGKYEASDSAENHMKAEDDDTDFSVKK